MRGSERVGSGAKARGDGTSGASPSAVLSGGLSGREGGPGIADG